jgi:fibronectin-binding autotransporter adhesin
MGALPNNNITASATYTSVDFDGAITGSNFGGSAHKLGVGNSSSLTTNYNFTLTNMTFDNNSAVSASTLPSIVFIENSISSSASYTATNTLTLNGDGNAGDDLITLTNAVTQEIDFQGYTNTTVTTPTLQVLLNGVGNLDVANSAGELFMLTPISGSNGLTKDGAGILVLAGANTYTGGTTINAGTLRLAGGTLGAVPSSGATPNLTLNNSTLLFTSNLITSPLDPNRTIAIGSGTTATSGTATIDVANSIIANVDGAIVNSPVVAGLTGNLVKVDSGTLALGQYSNSTYTGTTTIGTAAASGGTLLIDGTLASPSVSFGAGGGTLGGFGTLSGAVVTNSAAILSPGDPTSFGAPNGSSSAQPANPVATLTMLRLTLVPGSTCIYEFSGSANDMIYVTSAGGLSLLGGGFDLYQPGTTTLFDAPGTYDLIQYTGTFTGSVQNLSVLNPDGTSTYSFGNSIVGGNQFVTLTITPVPEPASAAIVLGLPMMLLVRRRSFR